MRRNLDPGTRKPLSEPLSKQRMIVCWLTLQIFAASPVVNTVFVLADMAANHPSILMVELAVRAAAAVVRGPQPPCDATSLLVPNSSFTRNCALAHSLLNFRSRHAYAFLPSLPNFPTARNYIDRQTGVNIEISDTNHCSILI